MTRQPTITAEMICRCGDVHTITVDLTTVGRTLHGIHNRLGDLNNRIETLTEEIRQPHNAP